MHFVCKTDRAMIVIVTLAALGLAQGIILTGKFIAIVAANRSRSDNCTSTRSIDVYSYC